MTILPIEFESPLHKYSCSDTCMRSESIYEEAPLLVLLRGTTTSNMLQIAQNKLLELAFSNQYMKNR